MNSGNTPPQSRPEEGVPPTDKGKMALAAVLLAIPIIALMWVPSYARTSRSCSGFPFFFWYQFLWVFICSAPDLRGLPAHAVGPRPDLPQGR